MLEFLQADPTQYTCIFGKNTTEAINKLAHRLDVREDEIILTTQMEHHSNDLPFRVGSNVVHIQLLPDGQLDEADLNAKLKKYKDRIRLLSVTGASNVTGYINNVHAIAEKIHSVGG